MTLVPAICTAVNANVRVLPTSHAAFLQSLSLLLQHSPLITADFNEIILLVYRVKKTLLHNSRSGNILTKVCPQPVPHKIMQS